MYELTPAAAQRVADCRALCGPSNPIVLGHADHVRGCPYLTPTRFTDTRPTPPPYPQPRPRPDPDPRPRPEPHPRPSAAVELRECHDPECTGLHVGSWSVVRGHVRVHDNGDYHA